MCDTCRWLALEGELYAVRDLHAMLSTNGVLITVTANVKTTTGFKLLPIAQLPWPNPCRLWRSHRRQMPPLGSFYCGGTPSSGEYMAIGSEQDLGSHWASRRRIKCPSSGLQTHSKLVLGAISQRLPSQLRFPCAEWHKKDSAGQWAASLGMPTGPLHAPHVTPSILHQMYPYVLWWAADLVATPKQQFLMGFPFRVEVCRVPVEQALRVPQASTVLLREEDVVRQVMDLVSPPWAPASVLALHLVSGLRDPSSMCSPRMPELSPAVWTATGG